MRSEDFHGEMKDLPNGVSNLDARVRGELWTREQTPKTPNACAKSGAERTRSPVIPSKATVHNFTKSHHLLSAYSRRAHPECQKKKNLFNSITRLAYAEPAFSDGLWGPRVARLNDVVEVVAHGDEQVEEQLPASIAVHVAAALFHLGLHGAAPLEGLAAPDDER